MAAEDEPPGWVVGALGTARSARLSELAAAVSDIKELSVDADTVDIMLRPLDRQAARRLESRIKLRGESWVYARTADDGLIAVDEPSEAGLAEPAKAVAYPELHTRLVSWWLVHAWRSVDLAIDAIEAIGRWRIASAVVTARALIEEAGCLLDESRKLAEAWQTGKALPDHPVSRPAGVRALVNPVLTRAGVASRITDVPEALRATNVLTYVQKLARATAEDRFTMWYDWLSDAAHPAFGARIAYASPPMMEDSKAVIIRWYARAPMELRDSAGNSTALDNELAHYAADATLAAGTVVGELLRQALVLVDDFGLTTGAATLTNRGYWRNFTPVRGSRRCPCGRGSWARCHHRWGDAAPEIVVPTGGPTWPDRVEGQRRKS